IVLLWLGENEVIYGGRWAGEEFVSGVKGSVGRVSAAPPGIFTLLRFPHQSVAAALKHSLL
ncbi:hypothetical protein, partial [Enterobacter sichuanensis]